MAAFTVDQPELPHGQESKPLTDAAVRNAKHGAGKNKLNDSGGLYLELANTSADGVEFMWQSVEGPSSISAGVWPCHNRCLSVVTLMAYAATKGTHLLERTFGFPAI